MVSFAFLFVLLVVAGIYLLARYLQRTNGPVPPEKEWWKQYGGPPPPPGSRDYRRRY